MSITYLDAISQIQRRGIEALKAAQSTQLASLRASRDIALAASRTAPLGVSPFVSAISELTTSFTFALLEQQVAYAKKITDSLVTSAPPTAAQGAGRTENVVDVPPSAEQAQAVEAPEAAAVAESLDSPIGRHITTVPATVLAEPIAEASGVGPVAAAGPIAVDPPHAVQPIATISEHRSTTIPDVVPVTSTDAEPIAAETAPTTADVATSLAAKSSSSSITADEPRGLGAVTAEPLDVRHVAFGERPVDANELASPPPFAGAIAATPVSQADHPAAPVAQVERPAVPLAQVEHPAAPVAQTEHSAVPAAEEPAVTVAALDRSNEEILSKTLPAPKAPAMSANAARKTHKASSVSNKRPPKPGLGKN